MSRLINRAIISVFDKEGIIPLAKALSDEGTEIISSGGTAKHLKEAGIDVIEVSDLTGFPEILDGRVKTLNPKIHAGILAKRENEEHMAKLDELEIGTIDCVIVNLYPFREVSCDKSSDQDKILENIDIGGPTLIRAAAKNFHSVLSVCDPADYPKIIEALQKGEIGDDLRGELAAKAFGHTGAYDAAIYNWFDSDVISSVGFPETMLGALRFRQILRYGENPHQPAALYERRDDITSFIDTCTIHQGKAISYNNFLDIDGALGLLNEFTDSACCLIVKHTNTIGLALGDDPHDLYMRALAGDPMSAFGGIIAFNVEVDLTTTEEICAKFFEIILAPGFTDDALKRFKKKKNWRIITTPMTTSGFNRKELEMKDLQVGVLVQQRDGAPRGPSDWKCVTEKAPADDEMDALSLAWKVVKHVKSNGIVIANKDQVLGIGMGQPSRVDAVRIAVSKAGEKVRGGCLASDAFFPFPDNIELAAEAGITAIVEPGGSLKDQEVIDAANKLGVAMMFTDERHFRH